MRFLRFLLLCMLLIPMMVFAQEDSPYVGRADLPAPEFPPGLDWINVSSPLTMQSLRGKVVLLDFWTYGCINCIHMIPTIRRLEEQYGDALAVIGVHSAKFENEGETENLRQIVQRYELHHPVINDSDFQVWDMYGARAWPSFVVIDPRGNLFARQAGEIPFEAFDEVIGGMIAYFDSIGEINREPLDQLALEGADVVGGLLAFPGKVLADQASNRLFIADTNHHRIVVAALDTYQVLDVIGMGTRGFSDGAFDAAQFNKPQGMALRGDILYVADTENHAIRRIDLAARTVTTTAGTGEQSTLRYPLGEAQPALTTAISSPWDVTFGDGDTLFVAMAGIHQIWTLDLANGTITPAIGSGREALVNSTLLDSDLAQPSGLFFRDGVLYFADSESSTVRAANIAANQLVTLAGTSANNLFDYGDINGEVGISRLQHPLAVTGGASGDLYVADTYNSTIKRLDPVTATITTLSGLGSPGGYTDGALDTAAFDEPGGLALAGDRLFVADTNNHVIRVIDLAAGTVSTLTFPNPEALQIADQLVVVGGNQPGDRALTLDAQTLAAGTGEIVLRIVLPEGYKRNEEAISQIEWSTSGTAIEIAEADSVQTVDALEIHLPITLREGDSVLYGEMRFYYCESVNESLCLIERVEIEAPVTVSAAGTISEIVIERVIVPPDVTLGGL